MATQTQTVPGQITFADPRVLHAFPEGSNVSLCGLRKAQGRSGAPVRMCRRCEQAAGQKWWASR